jgi:putative flippase GtrA
MKARKEIIWFFLAGSIVNATDFSVYYILFHFLPFSISKAISFTCAGIFGYLFSKYWIFKHQKPTRGQFRRYVLINFLALGINVFTNQDILNIWPGAVLPALVIAASLTGSFTFVYFKWWVFGSQLKSKDDK